MESEQWATKDRKPTMRQLYALAVALCEQAAEPFPETRIAASELIERLRIGTTHPGASARGSNGEEGADSIVEPTRASRL